MFGEFVCEHCGVVIERDFNAALNLKQLAFDIINGKRLTDAWSGSKTCVSKQAAMKRELY